MTDSKDTPAEINEQQPKKYKKPEGFKGRGEGATNWKKYKWSIIYFDKEKNEIKSGKFVSLNELNEKMGLNLSVDTCWRLRTHNKVDESKRNGPNSFLAKYGHIKIEKIDEWKEGLHHNTRKTLRNEIEKSV